MICYPFDSIISGYDDDDNPIYDRAVNSQIMADWMKRYFSDGIFGQESSGNYGFAVKTAGNGMMISVSPGACNIQGRFAEEDQATVLTLEDADLNDRIDAVVLRLSLETNTRSIFLTVIKGTPAANPVAPNLQRNSTLYDLKIAEVRVPKGSTTITQANIKDTRLNTDACGLVCVPMKVFDTSELYTQLEAALLQIEAGNQEQFDRWFETLQEVLDENTAGHLQNEFEASRVYRIDFTDLTLVYNQSLGLYTHTFTDTDIPVGGAHIRESMIPEIFLTGGQFAAKYSLETAGGSVVLSSSRGLAAPITGFIKLTPTNVIFGS